MQVRIFRRRYSSSRGPYARRWMITNLVVQALDESERDLVLWFAVGGDSIPMSMDQSIKHLGLSVLRSPPHSPKAKAICQRVIGTIRSEYLDRLIPLSESHFRSMLKVWVTHYNGARPHMALGPGVPDSPAGVGLRNNERSRHHLRARTVVCARSVLAGLHHEYSLAPQWA